MSATGNELVKLSQLRGTINGLRTDLQSANLTNTNTSIIQTTGGSLAIKDGQELVKKVSGQSYVWNQLVNKANYKSTETTNGITFTNNNDGSWTLNGTATADTWFVLNNVNIGAKITNHKYLYYGCVNGSATTYYLSNGYPNIKEYGDGLIFTSDGTSNLGVEYCYFRVINGTTLNNVRMYPQLFDLTQMGLGNITTVDQFKALFPNTYYPYQAPTLCSANNEYKNVGRNLWDEEWEVGKYNITTGEKEVNTIRIRCTNLIPVFPNTTYYFKAPTNKELLQYDINGKFIYYSGQDASNTTFTTRSDCYYITFVMYTAYGTTYNHDICINKSDASFNGTYESYQSNLLSYNGTLERKVGSVDLGSLTWRVGSGVDGTYFAEISDISKKNVNNTDDNVQFITTTNYLKTTVNATILNNNRIGVGPAYSTQGVMIHDTSITSVSDVASALSGKYIAYELATPTTEEIVNATNVELKGVGTAKDTLYNESGLASWKNGLTEQVNQNGIVAIPYSVSEEFAVSINGQLQHNLEVDKSQQEEIQALTSRMYFTEISTNNPAQLYGGDWTQVGTTTIGTTTIYCWKKGV